MQLPEIFDTFSRALDSCIRYPSADVADFSAFSKATSEELQLKASQPTKSPTSVNKQEHQIPLTPAQSDMCSILADFARVSADRLKANTTIHQIGLDSISAIQLAAKLRSLKGINISAADILQKPVIADLATLVQARKDNAELKINSFNFSTFEATHKPTICSQFDLEVDAIESVRPCTPLQVGLISQFLHSKSLYVNHVTYEMETSWTPETLSNAWLAVSRSHAMLRTGFAPLDNPTIPFAMVTYLDLDLARSLEINHTVTNVEGWRNERTVQFHKDMRKPPWAVLIAKAESRLLMHLTIFHGLYDAHSLDLIMRDLDSGNFEELDTATIDPVLSELMVEAGNNNVDIEARSQFWKDVMGDAVINKFPSLTPLISKTGSTSVCSKTCSKSLEELEANCSEIGITVQATGQAAWARLLSVYIGEPAVTFGVVLSGRDTIVGAEKVAFPCITTVPTSAVDSGDNWKLLTDMMQLNSKVRKHQFTSIRDIQRWTSHRQSLFDTIFAFQKSSNTEASPSWRVINEIATAEVRL
jgi:aryl carrier-like protein